MTCVMGSGAASRRFWRRRRAMFSTSMTASSTTSPMAMARPPSVMALRVAPSALSTTIAASSDSGMAVHEIVAVRRSNRNRHSTTTTRTPPSSRELRTLLVEIAMKSAGRNRSVRSSTCSLSISGFRSASASSTPSVTSIVLAPSCPETSRTTPGFPITAAPPIGGSGAFTTSATSLKRTLAPPDVATTVCAMSSGSIDCPSDWKTMR